MLENINTGIKYLAQANELLSQYTKDILVDDDRLASAMLLLEKTIDVLSTKECST